MSKREPGPLHWQTIISGLIVAIVGGVVVAFIIGEGRFGPPPAAGNTPHTPTFGFQANPPPSTVENTVEPTIGRPPPTAAATETPVIPPTVENTVEPTISPPPSSVPATEIPAIPSTEVRGQVLWNEKPAEAVPVYLFVGTLCEGEPVQQTATDAAGLYRFRDAFTDANGQPYRFDDTFKAIKYDFTIRFGPTTDYLETCYSVVDSRDPTTHVQNVSLLKNLQILYPPPNKTNNASVSIDWRTLPEASEYSISLDAGFRPAVTVFESTAKVPADLAPIALKPGSYLLSIDALNHKGENIATGGVFFEITD